MVEGQAPRPIRRAGFDPLNLNGRNGIEHQEGTWRTNTIVSSVKMAAGRF